MLFRPFTPLLPIFMASAALAQPLAQPTPTPAVRSSVTIDLEATTDDETISLGALGREADL